MTEHKLLERAKTGDRKAFREIVRINRPVVMAIAYDLTGSVEDAEDLAQDVFIRMYHAIGSFRGDAKLSSWLYRITVNTWISQTRRGAERQRSREKPHEDTEDMTTGRYDVTDADDPERAAEASLLNRRIHEGLKYLTPRERSVFMLRHFHDMKLADVSQTLGISEGSVKSLLFRAVRKMQKQLAMYRPVKGTVP